MSIDLKASVQAEQEDMVSVRRDIHAHPELSFKEERTAGLIAGRLASLGIQVSTGIATTGVVGILEGDAPGPTLMLRADIDGLPIQETSDAPYRSQNSGAMHACGHDGHIAALLGVASVLSKNRAAISGRVKFVFQPAEEIMSGAQAMIDLGVMENPKVDRVLGFHLWNALPVGQIGLKPGVIFSSADEFKLVVKGRGGHGALPHLSVDPVVISAHVITALQTLVSRETHPFQGAVLTIGTVHGGTAFNIIADRVEMTGTVRTVDNDLRQRFLSRIPEIAAAVCASMDGSLEFDHVRGCIAVENDMSVTGSIFKAASQVVGDANIPPIEPSTVGDDMALFMAEAPGCYFLVGSANPEAGLDAPHHSSSFDFDERALPIAAEIMARGALDFLGAG